MINKWSVLGIYSRPVFLLFSFPRFCDSQRNNKRKDDLATYESPKYELVNCLCPFRFFCMYRFVMDPFDSICTTSMRCVYCERFCTTLDLENSSWFLTLRPCRLSRVMRCSGKRIVKLYNSNRGFSGVWKKRSYSRTKSVTLFTMIYFQQLSMPSYESPSDYCILPSRNRRMIIKALRRFSYCLGMKELNELKHVLLHKGSVYGIIIFTNV